MQAKKIPTKAGITLLKIIFTTQVLLRPGQK